MAGIVGLRAEDMEQVDALQRARIDWPQGLPFVRPHVLAPVLVRGEDGLVAQAARFGFTSRFASFNARDDRIQSSPFWKGFFGRSHGIVPLSYVVEWIPGPAGEKMPYLIQRADGGLLLAPAFVGPYRDRTGETGFALCTRAPNRFFARFHDRMIGQCTAQLMKRWLEPEGQSPQALLECIHAPRDEELVAVPASPEIQKRQKGDWSPLRTIGAPLSWADLQAGRAPGSTERARRRA